MLRSAKLLPLCKGARTWLVAGTVYGPKTAADASGGDDNRREETSEARGYHVKSRSARSEGYSQSRPAKPSEKVFHSHANEPSAKTFAARNATLRQNALRGPSAEHSASGRGYPELGSGDGLASVGRLSVYKSRDNEVSVSASVKQVRSSKEAPPETFSQSSAVEAGAPSAGSQPASAKSASVEQEDCAKASSCEAGPNRGLQFNSSEPPQASAAAPIFGTVPPFGTGDLKCELEKPGVAFQAPELRKESNLEACNGNRTFSVAVASDLQSGSVSEGQTDLKGTQEAIVNGSNSTTSSSHKKGSQARHGHQKGRSNSNDSHKLVTRVCSILHQHGWGTETVKALDGLHTNLSAYQVNEILKQQKEAGLAYNFFIWARKQAGFKHDVHTYTTMLGILGRAKNFEVVNNLLGEMIGEGCQPNVVTYNRLIHCYGRANDLDASLKFFDLMQVAGCEPDRVTYCTLIDLQAKAGYHDSAMDLYRQMQHAGFRPDTFTYSIIIHCLGKAGKLNAAYKLFCEMTDRGFAPSLVTYNIIIDLHAKAGKFDMALKLYNDMQEVGYVPDRVTYGIIMEVLGHCGHIEEAEHVFQEMERAGWVPDNPIYGLMVDMWGKMGNAEKAAEWFNRMLDSGLQPNVPACNSLLSAYLRACFYDAAGQVLRSMSKWGLFPTLQTYTSLLSSCAACQAQWEYDMMFALMGCTGHPAHRFLCLLLAKDSEMVAIRQFFDAMQFEELESRRGFADSLIDFLHKAGKMYVAGNVWEVAAEKNLYPYAIKEKAPNYWSINLHVMSMGTAVVALLKTLASFREGMYRTGTAPYRIDIITGWGRRSRVPGASLVKQAVEDMLRALQSPFHIDGSNVGCFVGQGPALLDWLKRPQLEQMLHLL